MKSTFSINAKSSQYIRNSLFYWCDLLELYGRKLANGNWILIGLIKEIKIKHDCRINILWQNEYELTEEWTLLVSKDIEQKAKRIEQQGIKKILLEFNNSVIQVLNLKGLE